ncbi:MAG: class aldolase/adducin family protein [Acidimicrobiaceae bacterium]|jgi:ribulose-5-phosphate 4-epimerase/fuculose-1-phosphate aldolase|nr:class aldolase/adducin family protein [Acidimicrobiaceae bacterium]
MRSQPSAELSKHPGSSGNVTAGDGASLETALHAERAQRKKDLATSLRIFGKLGFSHGAIGHMTARDPVRPELFWVNPYRRAFATIMPEDLLLADARGSVVEGSGILNGPAYLIHARIHEARPDVVSAAHAHSPAGVAWSSTGRLLDPISQDSCALFERQAIYREFGGIIDNDAEATAVAEHLGEQPFLILQNHGILTAAPTVRAAFWWFVNMDRSCRVQLLAESSRHGPVLIPQAIARRTASVALDLGFADECFEALADEWT